MPDFIKRGANSQPYFAARPIMTDEYIAGVNELFFNYEAPFEPYSYHAAILLGSPLLIKDMARTARDLTHYNHISPVIMSGGPSPAYDKFGPEFIGCALYEILNGTFDTNLKRPESVRADKQLHKILKKNNLPRPKNILLEGASRNTYQNLEISWDMVLRGARQRRLDCIAIYGAAETLPRAVETFKTVTLGTPGENIEVRAVPYCLTDAHNWVFSPKIQSRIAAEVRRLSTYSDEKNTHIKNHIKLSDDRRKKLERVLAEIERQKSIKQK